MGEGHDRSVFGAVTVVGGESWRKKLILQAKYLSSNIDDEGHGHVVGEGMCVSRLIHRTKNMKNERMSLEVDNDLKVAAVMPWMIKYHSG